MSLQKLTKEEKKKDYFAFKKFVSEVHKHGFKKTQEHYGLTDDEMRSLKEFAIHLADSIARGKNG